MTLAKEIYEDGEWPFSPPPSRQEEQDEKTSSSRWETMTNFIQTIKAQVCEMSEIQQSVTCQMARVQTLEYQIQQSITSLETIFQQTVAESKVEILNDEYEETLETNASIIRVSQKLVDEGSETVYNVLTEENDNLQETDETTLAANVGDDICQEKKPKKSKLPKRVRTFKTIFNWPVFKRKNKTRQKKTSDAVDHNDAAQNFEGTDRCGEGKIENTGVNENWPEIEEISKEYHVRENQSVDENKIEFIDENTASLEIVVHNDSQPEYKDEIIDPDRKSSTVNAIVEPDHSENATELVDCPKHRMSVNESKVSESWKQLFSAVSFSDVASALNEIAHLETVESTYESLVLQSVHCLDAESEKNQTPICMEIESVDCLSLAVPSPIADVSFLKNDKTDKDGFTNAVIKLTSHPSSDNVCGALPMQIRVSDPSIPSPTNVISSSGSLLVVSQTEQKLKGKSVDKPEIRANVECSAVSSKFGASFPNNAAEVDAFETKL